MVAWLVMTLGLFGPWWLYKQSRVINTHCTTFKVPVVLIQLGMISSVVLLALLWNFVASNPHADFRAPLLTPLPLQLQIAQLVCGPALLIWTMLVRHGINQLSGAKLGEALWISLPITLLLQVFFQLSPLFLQYKINQILVAKRAV